MAMKLEFNSIKNQSIFQPEFQSFSANGYNVIEFKKQPMLQEELRSYMRLMVQEKVP